MTKLANKTVFITGASRGIGREIALRCAKLGANVVIAAKTDQPHPKLEGTIHTVAEEVEQLGAQALALQLDVRDNKRLVECMAAAAEKFGGIDILVNNASAIKLASTEQVSMSRFDLMFGVNVRATFACSKAALPYLKESQHAHILTLSPPLNMEAKWFKDHCAYTMSKYGMSMCTLGMAEEFKPFKIAVNSLWPRTTIATAAIAVHFPEAVLQGSRKPNIMADAAEIILTTQDCQDSGNFYIDETLLREHGVTDFDQYAVNPKANLFNDLYID